MGKRTAQARGDAVERTRMPWGRASIGVLLAVITLTGCGDSPCTGDFAPANGACAEGCPGLPVARVTSSCGVAPVVWCIPEVQTFGEGDSLYLRNTETGDIYIAMSGRSPDWEYVPEHIRVATPEERAEPCSAP